MTELRISRSERCDRLPLISAIATALLTVFGAAGETLDYDGMLEFSTVVRRTHPLFRQGCLPYDWLPRMPKLYFEPLVRTFADNLAIQRGLAVDFSLPAK